jgi:hypothetical protein
MGPLPFALAKPPRSLAVDVVDTATIGFRSNESSRLVVWHCTPDTCELREYRRDGRLKILLTLTGGQRRIACEAVDDRLVFSVDGAATFSMVKGREQWSLYSSDSA